MLIFMLVFFSRFVFSVVFLFVVFVVFFVLGCVVVLELFIVLIDIEVFDIINVIDMYCDVGNCLQVLIVFGVDGIVCWIEVLVWLVENMNWVVFVFVNISDEQIDWLLVVLNYKFVGLEMFWFDLGLFCIVVIIFSQGIVLICQKSLEVDVFLIMFDFGLVVMFVVELMMFNLLEICLWEFDVYKEIINVYLLYWGIILGIFGLLVLFLIILFVVKGMVMFLVIVVLVWLVFVYFCIDFGFWGMVFNLEGGSSQLVCVLVEVMFLVSLIVFFYVYLNFNCWNIYYFYLVLIILILLLGFLGVVVWDLFVVVGVVWLVFVVIGVLGFVMIVVLIYQCYDWVIFLILIWCFLIVWLIGGGMMIIGQLLNDIVQLVFGGGLVLIVLLIGFIVMQYVFVGGVIV